MVGYTRTDNTVTYVSPEFANFKVYAQYSLDNNAKTESSEGKSNADRYGALGVTYNNGPVHLVALADTYNWSSWQSTDGDADDGYTFTLGGYYNFGFMKVYLGAQYFDNIFQKSTVNAENMAEPAKYQDKYATIGTTSGQFQGYSITGGIDTPVLGGTAMLAVGYSDTEQTETADNALHKESMARLGASVGYTYALSKRTSVYGVAAYYRDSYDHYQGAADNYDMSTTTAWVGMVHRF